MLGRAEDHEGAVGWVQHCQYGFWIIQLSETYPWVCALVPVKLCGCTPWSSLFYRYTSAQQLRASSLVGPAAQSSIWADEPGPLGCTRAGVCTTLPQPLPPQRRHSNTWLSTHRRDLLHTSLQALSITGSHLLLLILQRTPTKEVLALTERPGEPPGCAQVLTAGRTVRSREETQGELSICNPR